MPTKVAAGLLVALASAFAAGAFELSFWIDGMPGPGLLPFAAAILLLPCAFIVMREARPPGETPFVGAPLVGAGLTGLYAFVVPSTGFVVATVALTVVWVRIFHAQSWLKAIAFSLALTLAAVVVFEFLLKVPMPLFLSD